MPKRFRSLRGLRSDSRPNVIDPPEYFDFDFRAGSIDGSALPRPSTAGSYRHLAREPTEDRPKTADRPVNKRLETTKVERTHIGLAIGSPTHTPAGWIGSLSPLSPQHAFREEGPFPSQQSSTWKKIGGIFKPRTSSLNYSRSPMVPMESKPSPLSNSTNHGHNVSLSTSPYQLIQPWSSLTEDVNSTETRDTIEPIIPTALPKLEIELPQIELPRYSVMFQEIMGSSSTSIVVRKNKALHELKIPKPGTEQDSTRLTSPRRATNPSMTKIQYSPFPFTTHPLKQNPIQTVQRQANDQNRPRSMSSPVVPDFAMKHVPVIKVDESNTEPAMLAITKPEIIIPDQSHDTTLSIAELPATKSPVQDSTDTPANAFKSQTKHKRTETANSAKPKPLITRRIVPADTQTSPEESSPGDKDEVPRLSTDSLQSSASSRTSVEEDIFFDLKPIRDANGLRGSQYVVINPDENAVQLARSISLKNKKKHQASGSTPEIHRYQWTPEMFAEPWNMPPDLQAAEHFCMSSDKQAAQPALRLSMFDKAIEEVERLALLSNHNRPPLPQDPDMLSRHVQAHPKGRGLAIGIPSPITERSCEGTPRSTPVAERHPLSQLQKRRIVAQTTASPTIIVSGFSSTFDSPPPVPRKDSKFLRQGRNTARPGTGGSSSAQRIGASKHSRPVNKPTKQSMYEHKDSSSRRRKLPDQVEPSMASVSTAAKPRAEFSIARTVSLTRKSSHKVFVKRQGGSDSRVCQSVQAH